MPWLQHLANTCRRGLQVVCHAASVDIDLVLSYPMVATCRQALRSGISTPTLLCHVGITNLAMSVPNSCLQISGPADMLFRQAAPMHCMGRTYHLPASSSARC